MLCGFAAAEQVTAKRLPPAQAEAPQAEAPEAAPPATDAGVAPMSDVGGTNDADAAALGSLISHSVCELAGLLRHRRARVSSGTACMEQERLPVPPARR